MGVSRWPPSFTAAAGASPATMSSLRTTVIVALVLLGAGMVPAATGDVTRVLPWTGSTPSLELRDLGGKTHALADYRGRVVLVNFWATWCEPCLDEMPSMRTLRERMAGQSFTILAVNYGKSPARIESFLPRVGIDFPVLLDRGQQVARAWRVRILPASFLVGPDGRIRYHVVGEIDWTSEEAVAAVRRLIGDDGGEVRSKR